MVEVFKTNVADGFAADLLIEEIQLTFETYQANFDLDDCDLILRVKSASKDVDATAIILLLNKSGFEASVLPDELDQDMVVFNTVLRYNESRMNWRSYCKYKREGNVFPTNWATDFSQSDTFGAMRILFLNPIR